MIWAEYGQQVAVVKYKKTKQKKGNEIFLHTSKYKIAKI